MVATVSAYEMSQYIQSQIPILSIHLFHAPSGDQAGSDASVGVGAGRSLNPVISTETSREENPPPRESVARVSRQNMMTRPFGAKVGPSTSHPSDRMRSPEPSG